ncbi:MAG: hypothetical protein GKR93_18475 [Gammaproteobacteria bacterium]|nr:hypothetical protein [Gammaproteobacteria bacterium]
MNLVTMNYEHSGDGVVIITIDVKDRPMNILTPDLHQDVAKVAEQLATDEKAIGAVIQSGKSSFVAGGDLKRLVSLYDLERSPEQAYSESRVFTEALRKLETCGKPVACAINGAALGGGLELALACHYRVVVNDEKIPLGLPETNVGLIPGAGGTQRLPRLIGIKDATELILSGAHISPQKALKLGLVHKVVNRDELLDEAIRWLKEEGVSEQAWDKRGFQIPGGATLNNPKIGKLWQDLTTRVATTARYNYPAPLAALEAIFNGTTVISFDAALKIETREFSKLTRDPVYRNMTRTLFLNKGIADKHERRPQSVEPVKVKQATIIGVPGEVESLALACATADIEIRTAGENAKSVAQSMQDYAAKHSEKKIESGRSTREKADALIARIALDVDKNSLAESQIILLTGGTQIDTLADLLADLSSTTLIASTTSDISIADITRVLPKYKNTIGWHIKAPVEKNTTVEIILAEDASDECIAMSLDFSKQLRKTPLIQSDILPLFSRHCNQAYMEEALRMVAAGIKPALLENAARSTGMKTSPLRLIDSMSLQTLEDQCDDKDAKAVLHTLHSQHDRKGLVENKGFYDYNEGKTISLWSSLNEHFPPDSEQVDIEVLRQRFLSIQALTALSYYADETMQAADADIASVLICGYPSYTGGMLSYIDTMGISDFIKQCDQLAVKYGPQFTVPAFLHELVKSTNRIYPKAV